MPPNKGAAAFSQGVLLLMHIRKIGELFTISPSALAQTHLTALEAAGATPSGDVVGAIAAAAAAVQVCSEELVVLVAVVVVVVVIHFPSFLPSFLPALPPSATP